MDKTKDFIGNYVYPGDTIYFSTACRRYNYSAIMKVKSFTKSGFPKGDLIKTCRDVFVKEGVVCRSTFVKVDYVL